MDKSERSSESNKKWLLFTARFGICCLILAIGGYGMMLLSGKKGAPSKRKISEKAIRVTTQKIVFEDKQVIIKGFGEVAPLNILTLSPEVSGRVDTINQNLEEGETIQKGDILFILDSRDYKSSLTRAEISVKQYQNKISQLNESMKNDQKRVTLLERNVTLAKKEYERLSNLLNQNRIGTLSEVEKSEQSYINLLDSQDKLKNTVSLYPLQIEENQLLLFAAQTDCDTARLNVERCTVKAPFDGRIRSIEIEKNLYVNKGTPVLTLADDSVLEIQVPLSFGQVYKWLDVKPDQDTLNWFPDVMNKQCFVEMNEKDTVVTAIASIHRIIRYDSTTRSVYLAVRIEKTMLDKHISYPITDGMYCKVKIPGRILENTVRLPEHAVNSEGHIYISDNNRLKTIEVTINKEEGGYVYISGGLNEGDLVITSKLINPLENSRVLSDVSDIQKNDGKLTLLTKTVHQVK